MGRRELERRSGGTNLGPAAPVVGSGRGVDVRRGILAVDTLMIVADPYRNIVLVTVTDLFLDIFFCVRDACVASRPFLALGKNCRKNNAHLAIRGRFSRDDAAQRIVQPG